MALGNLKGWCEITSEAVCKYLPGSHIVRGTYKGHEHAWVIYEGHIIDLTSAQFDDVNVCVVPLSSSASKKYVPSYTAVEDRHSTPKKLWEELDGIIRQKLGG